MQLLFTVYIGFRSYSALALMSILLIHFQRQGAQRLIARNLPALLAAAAAGMAFFAYKLVYVLVKLGDFDQVFEFLANSDFYLDAVIASEPFTTQMVLNECIRTDFETDMGYIAVSIFAQLTLFSRELGFSFISFNDLFQPQLFPEVDFGMAANIWAQMLTAGGWPLFLGFLAAYVWSLRLGSIWMATRRMNVRAGVALGAAYWAFYIHRNDLGFELSLLKRVLIVWLLTALVSEAVHRSHRSQQTDQHDIPKPSGARRQLRIHTPASTSASHLRARPRRSDSTPDRRRLS
jgi:hypothetical protein